MGNADRRDDGSINIQFENFLLLSNNNRSGSSPKRKGKFLGEDNANCILGNNIKRGEVYSAKFVKFCPIRSLISKRSAKFYPIIVLFHYE